MAQTCQDIINLAAKQIGVLASGETLNTDENADALILLNALVASWSTEELTVFAATMQTFALTPNQGTYTYGTGGNWNAVRPTKVLSGGILATLSGGNQMRIGDLTMYTVDQWAQIKEKNSIAQCPLRMYVDYAWPMMNVSLYPKPSGLGTPQIELYVYQPFAAFLTTDTFDMPQGYLRALIFNLAVDLYPMFPRQGGPDPVLLQQATQSKAQLVTLNASDKAAVKESQLGSLGQ